MKRSLAMLCIAVLILSSVMGCAANRGYSARDEATAKRTIITILGAAGGALIGSQIGGGSGKVIAVATGTALGGALAWWLTKGMDRHDREVVNYALENNRDGETLPWRNNRSDREYRVTPRETYRSDGRYCREFSTDIHIDGEWEKGYGTACRQPDGRWKIVSTR